MRNNRKSLSNFIFLYLSVFSYFCPLSWANDPVENKELTLPPLEKQVQKAFNTIKKDDILQNIRKLSSFEFQGRGAGMPENRKAAEYVVENFRKAGLLPGGSAGSYYQSFKVLMGYKISSDMNVHIGGTHIDNLKRGVDYVPVHIPNKKTHFSASYALVGYGITAPFLNFDEYSEVSVKGKIAIIFSGVPWDRKTQDWLIGMKKAKEFDTIEYKAKNAEKHGAAGVIIVNNPAGWRKQVRAAEQLRVLDTDLFNGLTIPVLHITRNLAAQITLLSLQELRSLALDIGEDRSPQSMFFPNHKIEYTASFTGNAWMGRNVIGILPGSDPKLKQEAVILGAHYDHLGLGIEGEIYHGANDNASGVSAIISIASAFRSLVKPPKRSIVFIAFDAEEIGRIGSAKYVAAPVIPIKNTVMMINFDMVGRNEPNEVMAVATRSSPEIHRIHQEVNRHIGLDIVNPSSFRLGRSDHTAFYDAKIPIMYLFGRLDPDYHSPQDTWDKINPEKTEKIAKLAFLTALEVANRENRIQFQEKEEE